MSFAQVVVTGQVLDAENNAPIVGASVTTGQGSTLRGVTSDLDGKFRIDVPHRAKITIRSIGYNQIILDKVGTGAKTVELGKILLTPDAVSLGQVEVIASVVPKDRKVPVPVSNISLKQIESKAFNTEFPELHSFCVRYSFRRWFWGFSHYDAWFRYRQPRGAYQRGACKRYGRR